MRLVRLHIVVQHYLKFNAFFKHAGKSPAVNNQPAKRTQQEQHQSDAVETTAVKETLGSLLPSDAAKMAEVAKDLGYESLPLSGDTAYTLTKGKESPATPGGYKGRLGLYEVFDVSAEIQDLILKRATSQDIQEQAERQGMVTMRQDGYLKALGGITTIEEVNRVANDAA